ncbi:MAG: PHP domain-containing protein [Parachlamydiaceae bacterium]|nr:PHP domain-containing protein [Parachlamydiaceae bacterium]
MNPYRADLHCHSTCSDGSLSPIEIIQLAKKIGLSALSITDHDTIEAYKSAFPAAKEAGIALLPGVEFSAMLNNVSVHVLGYGFAIDEPIIQTFCNQHFERRHQRNREILKLLDKHGMPISEEELIEACPFNLEQPFKHSTGRPHIALAMIKKGYINNIYDAFARYLAEGKSCYAQGAPFSVEETIDIIHRSKGIAIIAHPHLQKSNRVIKKLLEMNFDGMESYYGNFPLQRHQKWLQIALNKNWLITGGSDFHGTIKPHIPLGCSWIDEEKYQAVLNKLQSI